MSGSMQHANRMMRLLIQDAVDDSKLRAQIGSELVLSCVDPQIRLDDLAWHLDHAHKNEIRGKGGHCEHTLRELVQHHFYSEAHLEVLVEHLNCKQLLDTGIVTGLTIAGNHTDVVGAAARMLYDRWAGGCGDVWGADQAIVHALNGKCEFTEALAGLPDDEILDALHQAVRRRWGIPVWIGAENTPAPETAAIINGAFTRIWEATRTVTPEMRNVYQVIHETLDAAIVNDIAKELDRVFSGTGSTQHGSGGGWMDSWVHSIVQYRGVAIDEAVAWRLIGKLANKTYRDTKKKMGSSAYMLVSAMAGYVVGDSNHHKVRQPTADQIQIMANAGCADYVINVLRVAAGLEVDESFSLDDANPRGALSYLIRSDKVDDATLQAYLPEYLDDQVLADLGRYRKWDSEDMVNRMSVNVAMEYIEIGPASVELVRRWLHTDPQEDKVTVRQHQQLFEHLMWVREHDDLNEIAASVPIGYLLAKSRGVLTYGRVAEPVTASEIVYDATIHCIREVCGDDAYRWRTMLSMPADPGPTPVALHALFA